MSVVWSDAPMPTCAEASGASLTGAAGPPARMVQGQGRVAAEQCLDHHSELMNPVERVSETPGVQGARLRTAHVGQRSHNALWGTFRD